jgi:hypothetical protein
MEQKDIFDGTSCKLAPALRNIDVVAYVKGYVVMIFLLSVKFPFSLMSHRKNEKRLSISKVHRALPV